MTQYQTFPNSKGSSRTLEKLKALHIPPLSGKSFLDVGCNEGFFCGYAKFYGAARVVGIDSNADFIQRARRRFQDCEFYCQNWDSLPEGPFDVILFASALHYAADQEALIHALMANVASDGVLVIEVGIAEGAENEWIKVSRGIDERLFPTSSKLFDILNLYVWRYIGGSVAQQGDPTPRHVIHVHYRRPLAFLLLQPSGYGKTAIAHHVFQSAGLNIVSLDSLLDKIYQGQIQTSSQMANLVSINFSARKLNQTLENVFADGLSEEIVKLICSSTDNQDFVLDGYIPEKYHKSVKSLLREQGYQSIKLLWDAFNEPLLPLATVRDRAEHYYASLLNQTSSDTANSAIFDGIKGHVDNVKKTNSKLTVLGWALNRNGNIPSYLKAELEHEQWIIESYEVMSRPDVQEHFKGFDNPLCGFSFTISVPENLTENEVIKNLRVYAGNTADETDIPLNFSHKLLVIRDNMVTNSG